MSYKIRFDDITSFQTTSQTSIASWGQSIASINTAMSDFINDSSLQGEGIAGIRTYLSEVHGTLLQTLIHLMNDYSSSFLLYKDGYYNIESDHHAELPEQVFTTLQSDLKNSHDRFNHQLELLNAEKDKISDLVSYSGTSHTSTALDYGVLTTKLTTLDNAIQQYESNHVRQDLTAFKELVSATKALLSEYSGQTRKISSYRSGDLGKLQSVERFATAYQQVEQHITNTMDRVQAAQERDQARFEALAAEERSTKGWIDLALGAVTIAVGVAAIVASGGAATPLVVGAWIAGGGTVAYGLSNTVEAGHNLYLGYQGDGKTHATNPIRDILFMGNDKTYHQVGGLFTTASAVLIPIGKTQSVVKGLTEFTIGEVGGFAGHQAAYHGTKLLGGSEADAQRASFVGSILGGYAVSSAASKFSLNIQTVSPRFSKIDFTETEFDIELIRDRLKTAPDTAFFWSGKTDGVGGMDVAKKIAKSRGGVTLESTIDDANIIMPEWDFNIPSSMTAWEEASNVYAEQVSGEIRAVVGNELRPGNIWENIELPRLQSNTKVTQITIIDPKTGIGTIIFKR
ncbi:T7SS effector LXG polymorphic toxin [Streptococcus acidominimus]|uniref:T7SS effector LXG polymorphic toxin n=1 Tax=Streptococcus acidominimus TaxID=1326 RepID=UPI001ADDD885|nr:T7SS effector LXG polymorphic toxin [Streptococcus acidominimus]